MACLRRGLQVGMWLVSVAPWGSQRTNNISLLFFFSFNLSIFNTKNIVFHRESKKAASLPRLLLIPALCLCPSTESPHHGLGRLRLARLGRPWDLRALLGNPFQLFSFLLFDCFFLLFLFFSLSLPPFPPPPFS